MVQPCPSSANTCSLTRLPPSVPFNYMSARRSNLLLIATLPLLVAAVVAVSVLLLSSNDKAPTRPNQTATPTSPQDALSAIPTAPQVLVLKDDLVLVYHSAAAATTEFGPGTLEVSFEVKENTFRWIEGAAPTSGGRVKPSAELLGSLPANLPAVLTYVQSGEVVSVFARLAAAPVVSKEFVLYKLSLYDAPGKDSTYTVSGSYDIPEVLDTATIAISGQAVKR